MGDELKRTFRVYLEDGTFSDIIASKICEIIPQREIEISGEVRSTAFRRQVVIDWLIENEIKSADDVTLDLANMAKTEGLYSRTTYEKDIVRSLKKHFARIGNQPLT